MKGVWQVLTYNCIPIGSNRRHPVQTQKFLVSSRGFTHCQTWNVLDASMFIPAFAKAWWFGTGHRRRRQQSPFVTTRTLRTLFRWFSPPACLGCGPLWWSPSVGRCRMSSLEKSARKMAKVTLLGQIPRSQGTVPYP